MGARLLQFQARWTGLTNDPFVISIVQQGLRLPFINRPPLQPPTRRDRRDLSMPIHQTKAIQEEIHELLLNQAIEPVSDLSQPGFFHHPFAIEKPDGRHRPISDLRPLNQWLRYEHFQMESIKSVREMLRPGNYMARLDLKSAYLHVPVHPEDRPYLDFYHAGRRYRYRCLPFGLSCAPRVFTKLMKPVIAHLRSQGIRLIIYLDDMLIVADTSKQLQQHLQTATSLLTDLGFLINTDKSVLQPTTRLKFLGFDIDSSTMTMHLPRDKVRDLRRAVQLAKQQPTMPLRVLASLIGKISAASPAILPGRLNHRFLLRDKNRALQRGFHYGDTVTLSAEARMELDWWDHYMESWNGRSIIPSQADLVLTTDASEHGWGAHVDQINTSISDRSRTTNGPWSPNERSFAINVRELLAVEFGLRAFLPQLRNKTVSVRTDNITTVAYINKMGGTRSELLLQVAKNIWNFCLQNGISLQATYLPGAENTTADRLSRLATVDKNDWRLHSKIFRLLQQLWGPMDVDLFASRLSRQVPRYVSWRPDPFAQATDAFLLNWSQFSLPFVNPPFALLQRVLAKIRRKKATVVLIAPLWPSQPFFPLLLEMVCDTPRLLPNWPNLVRPPPGQLTYLPPQGPSYRLIALKLSGNISKVMAYRRLLSRPSTVLSGPPLLELTNLHGESGMLGVIQGTSIPLLPLIPTSSII